jgi:hypothetical protein
VLVPGSCAIVLLAFTAAANGRDVLSAAENKLASRLAAASPREVLAATAPIIDRHPADYLLYDLAGSAFSRSKPTQPEAALAFANRALYLRPLDVEAHRVAARSLLSLRRRSQGLLEYRLAYEAGQEQPETLDESVLAARGAEELRLLVPQAPIPVSQVADRLWSLQRKSEAEALVSEALSDMASHPDAPELWLLQARSFAERRDFGAAIEAVVQAERTWPASARVAMARSSILWESGARAEAIALLEQFFSRHPNELELALGLAQRLMTQSPKRAREVLSRASPLVATAGSRSRWLHLEGESFEIEGQYAQALHAYQAAAAASPGSPESYYSMARALEALQRPGEAMDAVREAMKHEDPTAREHGKARLAELEQARRKLDALRDEKLLPLNGP